MGILQSCHWTVEPTDYTLNGRDPIGDFVTRPSVIHRAPTIRVLFSVPARTKTRSPGFLGL